MCNTSEVFLAIYGCEGSWSFPADFVLNMQCVPFALYAHSCHAHQSTLPETSAQNRDCRLL